MNFPHPHIHAPVSVQGVMRDVMLALIPATLFGMYLFGWPAINLWVISLLTAIAAESLALWVMRKPQRLFLSDGSALLTGWLVGLSLPPWAPWWIAVVGTAFAVIVGKQVFGGLGQNVFNPAMLARVMLLVAFPLEMTTWITPHPIFAPHSPDFIAGLEITFIGFNHLDAVTSASLLSLLKTELTLGHSVPDILAASGYDPLKSLLGQGSGSFAETSSLLLILGGIYLLWRRVISWHIPLAIIGSMALWALLFSNLDPQRYVGPVFHVLNGGALLAAFFIATDPVTSPSTAWGKIIFGVGCGTVEYVIRTWGGFPEGIGFGILLMNAVTPLLDHYIRPRIYGRNRSGKPLENSVRGSA
jgi:Na+-translocating ferredoxin:NAD+ oxidoreductase subunit D